MLPAFLRSKTILSQIVKFIIMILAMVGFDIDAETQVQILGGLIALGTLVDTIIRYFTTEPMSAKAKPKIPRSLTVVVLAVALTAAMVTVAYAGGKHSTPAAANVSAAASASVGGSTYVALPSGGSAGLSNSWQCATSYSVTIGFIGWALTEADELCQLVFQTAVVCTIANDLRKNEGPYTRWLKMDNRCHELQNRIAAWEPAKLANISAEANE